MYFEFWPAASKVPYWTLVAISLTPLYIWHLFTCSYFCRGSPTKQSCEVWLKLAQWYRSCHFKVNWRRQKPDIDGHKSSINSAYWVILHAFCRLFFFFNQLWKNLSGIPSECQTVCVQIRSAILSSLISVQTICQLLACVTSRQRVKHKAPCFSTD